MDSGIEIRNLERNIRALAQFRGSVPEIADKEIELTADVIKLKMRMYPPPPAGSRYRRTYTLQNAWKVKRVSGGFSISADPILRGRRYGIFVVGDDMRQGQAAVHTGRWKLFRDVADDQLKGTTITIRERLRTRARQEGL